MSNINNILKLLNIQCKFTNLNEKGVIDCNTHLIVHLDFKRTPHRCSCGKASTFVVKDRPVQNIKWLDCGGRQVIINLRKTRWKCKCCNKTITPSPKFINRYNRISKHIKHKIALDLVTTHSLTSIAKKYRVSVNTVIRVMNSHFENKRPYIYRKLPKVLLIDEFKSVKNIKGAMSFIIVDGETGEIFDIVENRQLHYLERYFRKFELDVRSRVEYVGMDMYEPYITLVNRIFPNANICFDKFHVVNHIARAFIKTRIKIMKNYSTKSREYRLLKRNWKLLQKYDMDLNNEIYKPQKQLRNKQLTTRQFAYYIAKLDDELWQTYKVYQHLLYILKTNNYNMFDEVTPMILEDEKVSSELRRALLSLIDNKEYIHNNMKYGYNTGIVENTIRFIKQMKNNAFGFRSYENMKRRILIRFNLLSKRY